MIPFIHEGKLTFIYQIDKKINPKSHWGVKPKIIPKNNKLFLGINGTQGGNRTRTP